MRTTLTLLFLGSLLTGCSAAPPAGTAPSPTPTRPPAAWLIIGDTTVRGTQGSSCGPWGCWDVVPPQEMPGGIAIADLAPGTPAIIVVDYAPVTEFSVFVQDWSSDVLPPEGGEHIDATSKVEGSRTIITLAPMTDTADKLLYVSFESHPPQENAMWLGVAYTWQLNPAR